MTWVAEGQLATEQLSQSLTIAGTLPGPVQWRKYLDGLALWLGAVFHAAALLILIIGFAGGSRARAGQFLGAGGTARKGGKKNIRGYIRGYQVKFGIK